MRFFCEVHVICISLIKKRFSLALYTGPKSPDAGDFGREGRVFLILPINPDILAKNQP